MAPRIRVGATDEELRNLQRQGWVYLDMAKAFGVTEPAVWQRFRAMGETEQFHRNRLTQHIRVDQKHKSDQINQMLRSIDHIYLNKEEGRPADYGLSDRQVHDARRLLEYLHEENLIVMYSRDRGWYLTDRTEADGDAEVVVRSA